ncbi:MAG TPA: hypothetical protein DC047_02875 [Blastocatellia bacterium]|nr:hypothetical protein [Blastocatellia bacterium]
MGQLLSALRLISPASRLRVVGSFTLVGGLTTPATSLFAPFLISVIYLDRSHAFIELASDGFGKRQFLLNPR